MQNNIAAFLAQGDIQLSEYVERVDYSYGEIIRELLKEQED